MPRSGRSKKGQEPAPRPQLTVALADAQEMVQRRFQEADQLADQLRSAATDAAVDAWWRDYRVWDDFNRRWLAQIDASGVLAGEYARVMPSLISLGTRDTIMQRKQRAEDELNQQRTRLRSIATGLPLYGSSAPEGAGEAVVRDLDGRPQVFVVHGHDKAVREAVARTIERVGLEAVLLREKPNQGRTLLEKLIDHAVPAKYAVVILTGDDLGGAKAATQQSPRARQNVVFEFGLFVGLLGRDKVCVLYEQGVELPSDVQGIAHYPLDDAEAWRTSLVDEMAAGGLPVRR